jgi:tetratricopeptide (TPR) repeat protein
MNHYHYSWHLYLFDSLDKALEEHKLAFELDPLDPFQAARLGHMYLINGKIDSAEMEIERSRRLRKDFPLSDLIMGQIHWTREQYDSAEISFKRTGFIGKCYLAANFIRSGQTEKALEVINEVEANINPYYAVGLSKIYSGLNNADKFFEYANYSPPHAFHPWLRVIVDNPNIITDPRFKQLMDKMNLPMPDVGTRD